MNKLRDTVKSILQQTYRDLQIILIDDGSTDGSSELCDMLAGEDERIAVIHQMNQGVSAARNAGLEKADGKLIGFVDSDDIIQPNMMEKMAESIQTDGVDLVVCGVVSQHTNRKGQLCRSEILSHHQETVMGREQIAAETIEMLSGSLMHSVWNKLYKSDIIRKNQILFPVGIPLGEDLLFNLQYLKVTESVHFIPDCFYNYLSDEQSGAVTRFRENKHELMTMLYNNVVDYAEVIKSPSLTLRQEISFLYVKWIYSCFMDLFFKSCPLSKKEKRLFIQDTLQKAGVNKAAECACGYTGLKKILSQGIYRKNVAQVTAYSFIMYIIKFRLYKLYSAAMKLLKEKGG